MTATPLLTASLAIQLHVLAALLALGVAIAQFALPRGTPRHRGLGWVWIALMTSVALSSFFIHEIRLMGPWSPIHLLSILTLVTLVAGVRAIRSGNVRAHRRSMLSLFVFALIGTGAFTFMPGRIMYAVVFGP
ncbi:MULTISPECIES: DUF2306 domain-containing protein [unclassified Salinisphaera]|uniref:DUF2306 domain-containing protein n=1 Tax=unclassified Salinisphaera TaxID=2649847 RepID=UPI003340A73D